jgi:hypothetical protein
MTPAPPLSCFIGFDPSQLRAFNVAQRSLERTATQPLDVWRLSMDQLRADGIYQRPTRVLEHGYWDEISGAPMATGHAIARFLVPFLCRYEGWAVFTDGDVLFRRDIARLFALADESKAVQVVRHAQAVVDGAAKMSGEKQTLYARKNWSSVILWNCAHPFNRALTPEMVNALPGRMLHRFCWLEDAQIGALPGEWNVLIGETHHPDPAIAHFTLGCPDLPGYEHCEFAGEWYEIARAAKYMIEQPPLGTVRSA